MQWRDKKCVPRDGRKYLAFFLHFKGWVHCNLDGGWV